MVNLDYKCDGKEKDEGLCDVFFVLEDKFGFGGFDISVVLFFGFYVVSDILFFLFISGICYVWWYC